MHYIYFLISGLSNGGAERVISVLSDYFCKIGYKVSIIVTDQDTEDAMIENFNKNLSVISVNSQNANDNLHSVSLLTRILQKLNPEIGSIFRYYRNNKNTCQQIKSIINSHDSSVVIAFLNRPVFLSLLSKKNNQKLIISERNDPSKFVESKTTMAFIHRLYNKADFLVCQSPDAEKWYKENSKANTRVIFNPIKSDLPEPFTGTRKKKIVNFCRISTQKNLLMLTDAFSFFIKDHPGYELEIIGDESGNGAEGYRDTILNYIEHLGLSDYIKILPGKTNVHEQVVDYAMFVSSSDFEGMSNSMLEAMAMGMPVVCTDCPAGGARAVIKDGENGLLVPVGDAQTMAKAMSRIVDEPGLAEKLGSNAAKLRDELSPAKIADQWMKLIVGE